MSSRVRALAWTAAGVVALAMAVALVIDRSGEEDGSGDAAVPDEPVAAETVTEPQRPVPAPTSVAQPPPPAPTSTTTLVSSTTTSPPSTTTTTSPPPQTTTAPAPAVAASGEYTAVPKPDSGPNTIAPGGALTKHLAADIAAAFGFTIAEVEAAVGQVELPPEAGGNPEGWLAPGSYDRAASDGALEVVQTMVDRRVAQLEERNIPRDEWHRVLTAASVIETETYNQNEKPGVARVLTNRLAGGGPLQMDSIILYPVPEDRIFTTSEERASNQPYNSYRHNGLPPTPISAPDEASLDAFLAPPPGDWWFYVTIDLHSGETRYAVAYEDHQDNVRLLKAWLREHPTP